MNQHATQLRILIAIVLLFTVGTCEVTMAEDADSANVLACRLANYGKFQEAAWDHLQSIGFKYVFMNIPEPDQLEATQRKLAEYKMQVAVFRGSANLAEPSCLDELTVQLETCEKLGAKYMFLSPKHPGATKEVACEHLRQAGEIAKKHGVTIVLETHPDLGTNGDVHLETMKRIDHPNVRVNFDVANISYYNKNTSAVAELEKIIDYVATIELKDHNGQFETWYFPALGEGMIDFPGILKVLKQHHFTGPMTIEVEGIEGTPWNEAETLQAIRDSATLIRSLGDFK